MTASTIGAQRLTLGSRAAETILPDVQAAFCTTLTGGYRVCRVRTSEDGNAGFLIQKEAATVTRIDGDFWSTANAGPDQFVAYRGDLDADGKAEIVLVVHDGTSNGMGVSYTTVYIFNGAKLAPGADPLSFHIQEFGDKDNFVYNPGTRRTEILISYWADYDSIEPKRISGVYLIGKWCRYRNGLLEPLVERPTRARRLLNGFAAERDNGGFEHRTPNAWLKDRRTRQFLREPDERSKPVRIEFGTISRYTERQGDDVEGAQFEFALDGGRTIAATTRRERRSDNDSPMKIQAFGVWKHRYVFPMSWGMELRLSPFFENVERRRVRIETYNSEFDGEFSKVWLLD